MFFIGNAAITAKKKTKYSNQISYPFFEYQREQVKYIIFRT